MQKYCNDDVEWYKSVKGSVEVASYGQMDNIFECGCYLVGGKQPMSVAGKILNDVIQLQLKEKNIEKCLAKNKYSLEELRDLESKLVLITGKKAENRNKVDLFVNVSVIGGV